MVLSSKTLINVFNFALLIYEPPFLYKIHVSMYNYCIRVYSCTLSIRHIGERTTLIGIDFEYVLSKGQSWVGNLGLELN
jgi:hypothetical protein